MQNSQVNTDGLEVTEKIEDAEYVKIVMNLYPNVRGIDVTEGKVYEVKIKHYNGEIKSERYIINDVNRELFGFETLCKVKCYKRVIQS